MIMDTLFEESWITAIRVILGPLGYVKLIGYRLQGLLTGIFVKKKHIIHVRDIHTSLLRTGFGGFWGNKGAIAIRMTLYGCSLCFLNCHLAPHDTGYEERCNQYNSIIDYVQFPVNPTIKILYHDYVLWLGDLNFRLTGEDPPADVANKVFIGNLDKLLMKDELRKAQKTENAFGQLTEPELKFPPTYKYHLNSSDYNLSRKPAWTDRILYQVHVDAYENAKLSLETNKYLAIQSYDQSDHKPVIADFTIRVFAKYKEKMVRFKIIEEWLLGGINKISYTLENDVSPSPWDYLAMFKDKFTSMDDYITYAYVALQNKDYFSESYLSTHSLQRRNHQVVFNDALVQTAGIYRILYYSENHKSYLGMSNAFEVKLQ